MSNSIITVIGTPKSGISILGQCLRMLDLTSIDDQAQTDTSTIHGLLFQDLDHSPTMAGPLPQGWMQAPGAERAKQRIGALLSNCRNETCSLFLADPFLCRFMPLWAEAFQEAGLASRFVLMVRHPWEAAPSLALVENIDLAKAHLLWLAHVRDALRACQDQGHVLVAFDQLLADPVSTLVRMGTELDLTWPNDPWSVSSSLLDFVQPKLKRHHISNLPDKDKHAFQAYERLYQEIRRGQWAGMAEGNAVELRQLQNPNATLPTAKGIISAPSSTTDGPDLVESLLEVIGQYEKQAASRRAEQERTATEPGPPLFAQVVFPSTREGGEVVETIPLIADEWQHITLPVPEPTLLRDKPMILKPLNTNGTVIISAISLVNQATGVNVWTAKTAKDFDRLTFQGGKALRLPDRNRMVLLVTDPGLKVAFTVLDEFSDGPLELSLWIKTTQSQACLSSYLGTREDAGIESKSKSISNLLCDKLSLMNNTWDFHHQFSARKKEFKIKSAEQAKGELMRAKTFWGRKMLLIPGEVVSATIYSFGFFEPNLVSFCVDYLRTGQTVLDVGAHIGFFSLLFTELVGEHGKILSFEPTPSTADILKMNTTDCPQVAIVPKLAWHKTGPVKFHDLGSEFSAYNTAVSDRLEPEQKKRAEDNRIMVDAVTLDDFVLERRLHPDLVKLDVENAEMHVLKGMTGILDRARPVITIEVGDINASGSPDVPTSRELLEFVIPYFYMPLESVSGRYQEHELKTEKYAYDNIIMVPRERLPIRQPLGTVAVQQGKFF